MSGDLVSQHMNLGINVLSIGQDMSYPYITRVDPEVMRQILLNKNWLRNTSEICSTCGINMFLFAWKISCKCVYCIICYIFLRLVR